MRFQHSQLAIASEPLLFLFLDWHNWKLVSTNVQVQLGINVSSAVAKTLSKTGITNLTKLHQKKMTEKYGSKGHIIETETNSNIVFFIACDNYHLFRRTTTSNRGFIKANEGTSSTHQMDRRKNGTILMNLPGCWAQKTSFAKSFDNDFLPILRKNPTKKPWAQGSQGSPDLQLVFTSKRPSSTKTWEEEILPKPPSAEGKDRQSQCSVPARHDSGLAPNLQWRPGTRTSCAENIQGHREENTKK